MKHHISVSLDSRTLFLWKALGYNMSSDIENAIREYMKKHRKTHT